MKIFDCEQFVARIADQRGILASAPASWSAAGEGWGHTPLSYSPPPVHGMPPPTTGAHRNRETQISAGAALRISSFGFLSDFGFRISGLAFLLTLALTLTSRAADLVKVSGSVVDKDGKPVADASVDYYQYNGRTIMSLPDIESKQHATTDNAGAFSFSVPRGAATIVATKSGLAPAWITVQSTPEAPIEPLVLTTPAVLGGTVLDENEHPLANAEVSVSAAVDKAQTGWGAESHYLFGKAAHQLFSARTSSDGRFRIENFPANGQASLAVTIPGRALRPTTLHGNAFGLQAHAGEEDIKLVTDPAGSIEGKVVLRESSAPVAGVKLQLQSSTPWGGRTTEEQAIQSAADGSFRIPDLSPGSYTVTAIFTNKPVPAWVTESVPVTVTAGETSRNVLLQAIKGGTVEVTVAGKDDHKPIPDVGIGAYAENYQASATTDSNGIAHLRLPAGQYNLNAFKQGHSQASAQTTVSDGQTTTEKIELNAPLRITGTVKDTSGTPLANTSVAVVPNYGAEQNDAKSDSSGHYQVTWELPNWRGGGNQHFYVLARNQERNLAGFHEVDESTKTIDVELKPAMSVSARIQDTKGNAVTNANCFLTMQTDNFGFNISRQPISSDQQGRIHVQTLPLGEQYSIYVNAQGYGSAQQQMDNSNPKTDHYDFPPITLNIADRKLSGRVLGTNGQPVAGANVWMNGEGQPNGNATTDANGRFTFDAVCAGPINVQASAQGLSANAEATGGDTNVLLRFNKNQRVYYGGMNSRKVSGTVFDTSGRPAVGAHVSVTPSWGNVDHATTDENGEYKVSWDDQNGPRNTKSYVLARDPEHGLAGMELLTTNTEHVSVHLEAGFSLSGTVLDSDGSPLTRANVNLNIMLGNYGGMVDQDSVKIGSDGTFTIPALPPGQRYNLWISSKGYGSAQKQISQAQSRSNTLQLPPFKLRTADRELAGQVLDSAGKPVARAQVNIWGNNQPNDYVHSDDTGHFKFKVCSGPVTVYAYSPNGGGANNYGNVQVRGGDMNVVVKFGQRPNQTRGISRAEPLKPRPWSLAALIAWPANHKIASVVLLGAQTGILLAAGGLVLWATTRKRQ